MASEGGQRADALEENGCNYFGKTTARSCPFAFYYHSDVIHLAVDLGVHIPEIDGKVEISKEKNEFGDFVKVNTDLFDFSFIKNIFVNADGNHVLQIQYFYFDESGNKVETPLMVNIELEQVATFIIQ